MTPEDDARAVVNQMLSDYAAAATEVVRNATLPFIRAGKLTADEARQISGALEQLRTHV